LRADNGASLSQGAPQSDPLANLAADASLFAQKLDFLQEKLLLVRMTREAYRAASFLDDRILTPQTQGGWIAHAVAAQKLAAVPEKPLHFIFHAGHVGSTLVSRLLDETGLVHPLREPMALRQLAEAHDVLAGPFSLLSIPQFDFWLDTQIRLWRRGFPETQAVILKATSSATRLGGRLLAAVPKARAIHFNLASEPYLATLLAGENSPIDLRGMGAERLRRLQRILGAAPGVLHQMSLGELAAMTWLAERLTQAEVAAEHRGRLLAFDFDAFLQDVPGRMANVIAHFGLQAPPGYLAAISESPTLRRYSKALEHEYSPAFRSEVLAQSRARNAEEIRKGLAWLERVGAQSAKAAEVL
jgi:hypothetical protein